jgi:leucine dehydrogenase
MLHHQILRLQDHPSFKGHEKVILFTNDKTGLRAIISIHNTNLGPALGGCRFYPYASDEDAITDVLRLSHGMTYKSALAQLPFGGGKSVIIGDPKTLKNPELMQSFGEAIESLKGEYITAEDVGTGEHDMEAVAQKTSYVAGLDTADPHSVGGNPSPITAFGVFSGLKSTLLFKEGHENLGQVSVAVQGLGAVGYTLCEYLVEAGARLFASDLNQHSLRRAKEQFGEKIEIIDPSQILFVKADILAPCAMGGILNDDTIPKLQVSMIAGAANNQLRDPEKHDLMLRERNILYAPDFVINAGGVMSVAYEYLSHATAQNKNIITRHQLMHKVESIHATLRRIYDLSQKYQVPTGHAANQLAEMIFKSDRKNDTNEMRA